MTPTVALDEAHSGRWLPRRQPHPEARLRLLCFPYAGKGASVYLRWHDELPPTIDVLPVQLPGREGRIKEPPAETLLPLTHQIADAMLPLLDRPFAVFGHSMGSLIAFEVVRRLRERGKHPVHLFVSGRGSPELPRRTPDLHRLPDDALVAALQGQYGGIPDAVRSDVALLQFFLPTLRADLKMLETYSLAPAAKLGCPITAFGGRADPHTTENDLRAWENSSAAAFRLRMFDSDHFFLNPLRAEVLREITADLAPHLAGETRANLHGAYATAGAASNGAHGSNGISKGPNDASHGPNGSIGASHGSNGSSYDSNGAAHGANGAGHAHPMADGPVFVFPGQGSQRVGMGKALFDRYPDLVAQAESILGYSLRTLCMEDPRRELRLTQFTQPALFVVSALTYLAHRDSGAAAPAAVAGHSLGELDALFVAGVFDFATGVQLVRRRGELMSQANGGAMAAVLGAAPDAIRHALDGAGLSTLDIANLNSPTQTVVAGSAADVAAAHDAITKLGARYVPLNVSAPFHSRYMAPAQREFEAFLAQFRFAPPRLTVIANATARPYPTDEEGIRATLARQIASPVRWYESVSYLLAQGHSQFQELGPGEVLTRLVAEIRKQPMAIAPSYPVVTLRQPPPSPPAPLLPPRNGLAFLYTGQGSQYFTMGTAIYERDPVFRAALDRSAAIAAPLIGGSLIDILFRQAKASQPFDRILHSNPALLALGHALTEALAAQGVRPDLVIGYGVGEYAAAVIAGALSLEQGLALAIEQARLLEARAPIGAMLAVFESHDLIEHKASLFAGCNLAGVSFQRHFVLSGPPAAIDGAAHKLKQLGVVTFPLPIRYGLYSPLVDSIEPELRRFAATLSPARPRIPIYSPARGDWLAEVQVDDLWRACRTPVAFSHAIDALEAHGVRRYVDIGPSGTLASFIKHKLGDSKRSLALLTRFAADPASIDTAVRALGASL